jgi:hypothetical protein
VDIQQFWTLIEDARGQVPDPADGDAVADRASTLLADRPRAEIVRAQQALWDLMAVSYGSPLWAAAYVVNGGCSDDGFEYFRGWLITQGRDTFERVVAAPDELATLSAVREAAADGVEFECEGALAIASSAHVAATGEELPGDSFRIDYPALDPDWDFDFDDSREIRRRLPRLAALYGLN